MPRPSNYQHDRGAFHSRAALTTVAERAQEVTIEASTMWQVYRADLTPPSSTLQNSTIFLNPKKITDLPLDFLTRLRKLWFIDRADLEFEPNEGPKNMGNSSSFLINRDLRKQMQDVIYVIERLVALRSHS